jgi:hypothetical protein
MQHAKVYSRSPVWLLLHKLSSPHYRYIRKMRRGDRLPLTQSIDSNEKSREIRLRVKISECGRFYTPARERTRKWVLVYVYINYSEIIINRGVLIFADFVVHLNHEN